MGGSSTGSSAGGSSAGGIMGKIGADGGPPSDKSLKVGPAGNAPVVPLVDMRSTPVNMSQISALQRQYYQGLGG